jgi:uncharacterized protein
MTINAEDAQKESKQIIADTVLWLEQAVIGLTLCPFAKAEHVSGRISYQVSLSQSPEELLAELKLACHYLLAQAPEKTETQLLIHPHCLTDFLDFNDFLGEADAMLADEGLEGLLQVASFHPDYQFAGTAPDAMENYSNRSPYPTLHILREDSVARAVAAFPDAERIYERNIETLEALGLERYQALLKGKA